ncbi:uncharacterized protein BCR38DRAFT_415230 [Pseudomassariella vexata]|uniref:Uncharacterized protein n=1 Tax=Pseudomassariella vexata TaxID=1141098 RepID=A0A1Y2D6B4_9PEZI|nr:uncharacterized protein BCR38DRAFT_415230 [Pseudomassariella vexata]ORY54737.1 hypothetical protein BCR38DRAFT_415230 [Pseudomassariella vexata]
MAAMTIPAAPAKARWAAPSDMAPLLSTVGLTDDDDEVPVGPEASVVVGKVVVVDPTPVGMYIIVELKDAVADAVADWVEVETLEMVMVLVIDTVDVSVLVSATAKRGRSAMAIIAGNCIVSICRNFVVYPGANCVLVKECGSEYSILKFVANDSGTSASGRDFANEVLLMKGENEQ